MIDWLSLKINADVVPIEFLQQYATTQDRIIRISGNGEKQWETIAWESVRSDSHQIALQVTGNYIRIQGSPARVIADGDNVFSSGASAAGDLLGCFERMTSFVIQQTGIPLPSSPDRWKLTRVDVTCNLHLGTLPAVRQALSILRDCEGGRYRVSQQAGDTVYWSHRSRLRAGKAYAKGAELMQKTAALAKKQRQFDSMPRTYELEEMALAAGLLRLELKLGAQFWRRYADEGQHWYEVTPEFLHQQWESYFSRMIGGADMPLDQNIYERLLEVVERKEDGTPKEGQAKAAYGLWLMIQDRGWQAARDYTTPRTWYRNLKIIHAAGLSDADISKGKVTPIRREILKAVPVHSWAQLRQVANSPTFH